jgi:formylmethanofuran dehydrogenase subunit A
MGYTACFEPAVLPVNARQAHMEMGDTPMIDKGGYVMLGSDDFLLRLMAAGEDQKLINDYVAWTLNATRCIGIKVVNAGGISAFKFNQRMRSTSWGCPIRCMCTAATSVCRAMSNRPSGRSGPRRGCRST